MKQFKSKTDETYNALMTSFDKLILEASGDFDENIEVSSDDGIPEGESEPTEEETGEPDATMPTEEEIGDDIEQATDDAAELPTDEDSIIISKQERADIANAMLSALMSKPPESGSIPEELLTVTPENADKLINFIKNLIAVDGGKASASNMGNIANQIL